MRHYLNEEKEFKQALVVVGSIPARAAKWKVQEPMSVLHQDPTERPVAQDSRLKTERSGTHTIDRSARYKGLVICEISQF